MAALLVGGVSTAVWAAQNTTTLSTTIQTSVGIGPTAAMAFGDNGIFGNFAGHGTTTPIGTAKNVYNDIVSALNRGITPRHIGGNWTNEIDLNYWANAPVLDSATQSAGGSLTATGTYRYWITAYGILGDASVTNETTQSNVLPVPASFEVSPDGTNYAPSLLLPQIGGSVAITTLHFRLAASSPAGSPSGFVQLTSPDTVTRSLAVSGTVNAGLEPAYVSWISNYPSLIGNDALGTEDPDHDGFTNEMEFAFGGDPTAPTTSLSATAADMTISFIARNTSPAGATYQVQSTIDLITGFTDDNSVTATPSADQTGIPLPSDYQRLEFTVPLVEPMIFYRIKVTPTP